MGMAGVRRMEVIRYLHSFVAVAEEENFQRAAKRLNLAQPALSRRVQALESQLGTTLFERLPRGVSLNQAGRSLLVDARRILQDVDDACSHALKAANGEIGTLRIGINDPGLKCPSVVKAIHEFRDGSPGVVLKLMPLMSEAQFEALRKRKIDLAFTYCHPDSGSDFERINLHVDHFVLVMSDRHPLADRPTISLNDLHDVVFAWPSRAASRMLFDRLIAACQQGGLSPRIDFEIMSAEQAVYLAAMDMAISWLPAGQYSGSPRGVVLRPVEEVFVPISLDMIWRKDDASILVRKLAGIIAEAR